MGGEFRPRGEEWYQDRWRPIDRTFMETQAALASAPHGGIERLELIATAESCIDRLSHLRNGCIDEKNEFLLWYYQQSNGFLPSLLLGFTNEYVNDAQAMASGWFDETIDGLRDAIDDWTAWLLQSVPAERNEPGFCSEGHQNHPERGSCAICGELLLAS